MRPVLTLVVLAASLGPALADPGVRIDPTAVDRIAADALRRWQAPGLAIAVVAGDRVIVAKGYGTKQLGTAAPVTADTVFPIASCTKAFTTALLAALVADGKLDWDDPVRRHLPTFRLSDPRADALVSVRDLVTHRTGVPGHDLLWYRAPWDPTDTLRRFSHLPPTAPFRGAFQYNSIPFVAAGRVAQVRGGAAWEDLVRTRLTGPLGMTGVTFTAAEFEQTRDRAAGHQRTARGSVEPMPGWLPAEANPSGSMGASARALGPWLRFHLGAGTVDGKPLVPADALQETHTAQIVQRPSPEVRATYPATVQVCYAMGWVAFDYRGERVVAHGGVADGFRAHVAFLPDRGFGFALLNNLHDTAMNQAVGNALIDHALGLPPRDWHAHYLKVEADERAAKAAARAAMVRARDPNRPPSLPLDRYAGGYEDRAYGTGMVTVADGRLTWAWSSFRCPLEHWDGDTFRVTDGFFADSLLTFAVRGRGVTGVRAMDVDFVRMPPR